ncbi:MAG: hypothetical protein IPK16_10120 [Anaerolineales bacterium]|nr:hypothetical protein [Anaerolineales bacterium]
MLTTCTGFALPADTELGPASMSIRIGRRQWANVNERSCRRIIGGGNNVEATGCPRLRSWDHEHDGAIDEASRQDGRSHCALGGQ